MYKNYSSNHILAVHLKHYTDNMAPACDVPVGVITGDDVMKLHKHARDNVYAIPAFNCTRYVFATTM